MSRTYVHKRIKHLKKAEDDWNNEWSKHENIRCARLKRWAKRKIRHASKTCNDTDLIDAEAESGRNSDVIRNKYW